MYETSYLYAMSLCKISWSGVLARFLYKISIRGLWAISLYEVFVICSSCLYELSWQDLCKGPLGKISVQISIRGLLARTLSKLPIRALLARSRYEISVEALYKSSLGKIYVWNLLSLCNVFVQDLLKRCPGKISVQDLYKRSLGDISLWGLCNFVEAVYTSSLGKISVRGPLGKISTDLHAMPLYKISTRGLLASSLYEFPIYSRSLGKICFRDICTGSLKELSWQDSGTRPHLLARSLYKLPRRGLLARSLEEISVEVCIRALLARSL